MLRWLPLVLLYGLMACAGHYLGGVFHQSSWWHPSPWFDLTLSESLILSCLTGALLGFFVAWITPHLSDRLPSVRALSSDLQPFARSLPAAWILPLSLASSLGEELFFRGFLEPLSGVLLSSLAFGLLHQTKGKARFIWILWATGMGVSFGVLYHATGSLVGPVIAHALTNSMNLRYLKQQEPSSLRPKALGGILRRGSP